LKEYVPQKRQQHGVSALTSSHRLAGAVLLAGTVVVLARRLGVCADVDERGLVAVGLGDADDLATLAGGDTLDVDLAGALLALHGVSFEGVKVGYETYGAARAVDLAVVLGIEVDDLADGQRGFLSLFSGGTHVDAAAAVVLDDLVRGLEGTTADDVGDIAGPVVLLNGGQHAV
jgi:hypothetical protein